MAEIVEVEAVREIGDGGEGAGPVAIDGSFAEHVGAFTGEHAAVAPGCGEAAEVSLQFGNEERGEGDRANARLGLGFAHEELTGVQLDLLLLHPNRAVEEIDVAALEAEKFAATEAEETREQDQAPVAGWHRIGERPDLFDGRDGRSATRSTPTPLMRTDCG